VTTTAIAGGSFHSLAIGSNGRLYAWGWNLYGQLGDGTTTSRATPEAVTLAPGVAPTAVCAGYGHSLAIGSDGKLYAWGWNSNGQLGDGTTTDHHSPETIALASGVTPTAIAAGATSSYAIGSDGKLYTWGDNFDGQLGDGTVIDHDTPEAITLAPGVSPTAIAGGTVSGYAIGSDGRLFAWGWNLYGQLGDGTTTSQATPEAVTLAPRVRSIAIAAGYGEGLAIGSDGNLYVWGDNDYGQLGDGTTTTDHHRPEAITLAPGVTPTAIAAGYGLSLAIGSDGKLYAWGYNENGQLGDGTTTDQHTPEAITLEPGVTPTAVAAGDYQGLAIGSGGPPPKLPEISTVVAVPLIGGLLLAAAWWMRRRRSLPLEG
jgi:alpha-tubulin suppressor-like RCC1 family protein